VIITRSVDTSADEAYLRYRRHVRELLVGWCYRDAAFWMQQAGADEAFRQGEPATFLAARVRLFAAAGGPRSRNA
jgi:hypothetical protein